MLFRVLRRTLTPLLALALLASPARAAQVLVQFDAGGDGMSWGQAGNWSPVAIPNNGLDTYVVFIDQNGSYSVELDILATIDSLAVGEDDHLATTHRRPDTERRSVYIRH